MNLFELFVKIGVKDEATSKISQIAGSLGNGLKAAASVGGAAMGVAASGIAALTTAAVKNYAEYEQLVGGVDTLFKNASQKLQGYAAGAFQTAEMSANEYMSNVTGFSAALISSLGGDTDAAAEHANRAMVAISDNANKMGTDMSSIVATYQSLARGNFAMLDNLKLGYGGTKAELERLIKDAATYTDIQKEMGITVDASSMSFDNIVNAISVVQGKLGIAGATALEAGTTIEGSLNSMKAAWQNLLTGVADSDADFEALMDNFVTSVVGDGTDSNLGVFGNLVPRIESALNGAADLVSALAPAIFEILPEVANNVLPKLATAAVNVIQAFVGSIQANQGSLVETAVGIITTLANGIITVLPQIIETGLQLVLNLVIGLSQASPELIPAAVDMVMQIIQTLMDNIDLLIEAALALIEGLALGLIEALPVLIEAVPEIVVTIVTTLIKNLPLVIDMGIQILGALIDGIFHAIPTLGQAAVDIVDGLIKGLVEAWPSIVSNFESLISTLISAVKNILGIHSPSTVFASIGDFVAQGFGNGFTEAWGAIKEGIVGKVQDLVDWARQAAADIAGILGSASAEISNIAADGGKITSSLEARQAGGKTGSTYNYYINSSKQTATDIIKETKYINNRAVMTY